MCVGEDEPATRSPFEQLLLDMEWIAENAPHVTKHIPAPHDGCTPCFVRSAVRRARAALGESERQGAGASELDFRPESFDCDRNQHGSDSPSAGETHPRWGIPFMPGDRVRNKHSGMCGQVTRVLHEGMVRGDGVDTLELRWDNGTKVVRDWRDFERVDVPVRPRDETFG